MEDRTDYSIWFVFMKDDDGTTESKLHVEFIFYSLILKEVFINEYCKYCT